MSQQLRYAGHANLGTFFNLNSLLAYLVNRWHREGPVPVSAPDQSSSTT
jgi:hypothetical protein